jgi:Ca2+-binding RTX toxin-like protein
VTATTPSKAPPSPIGDGDDSFEGSAFADQYLQEWKEEIRGGPDDDTIATGAGNDRIVPGSGNDLVHGNGGADRVIADPTPDGNDVLDLGSDTYNLIDDSARTEPLTLVGGVLGGTGEADRLEGLNVVLGGSGNDHFVIAGNEFIKGGPGEDTLIGSEGPNYIYGGDGKDTVRGEGGEDRLDGGEGDDNVEGGAGNDFIEEFGEEEDADLPFGRSSTPVGGNDALSGGEGEDMILAGPGEDTVEGGPGNDRIFGEVGNDTLEGGAGDDQVGGDEGDDRISGGEGNDRLLAGRASDFPANRALSPVDTGVDSVFCGTGEDIAQANPWDKVASTCETVKRVRALKLGKLARNTSKGTALVPFTIQGTGALNVSGKGVRPVSLSHVNAPKLTTEDSGSFVVNPRGAARKRLKARGRVTVTMRLTWQPESQGAATETRRVKLVLKKKPAGRR